MNRRHPHVAFEAERIRPFLGERKVLHSELLAGGACNSNYRVRIAGSPDLVVRIYNRGSPEQDRHVMDLVRGLVPVPKTLYCSNGCLVMELLPGAPLVTSPKTVRAAGRALASIGRVVFDRPGQITTGGTIEPFPFAAEGFFATWLAKPEVQTWLGAETIRGFEELLAREAGRLAEIESESQLVHGDFNPSNILVSGNTITGVLDWEFAHSGSIYMDIGNLMRHAGPAHAAALAAGIRDEGTNLPPDWQQRASLIDLGSQLEFLTSDMPDNFKRRCVHRLRQKTGTCSLVPGFF